MNEQPENTAPHDQDDVEEMLCPHCLKPVDPVSHFCNECGGPTSAFSSIDPMGQVYSAGHTYRQATGKRVKFIVVLGMWLIFAPQVLPLLIVAIMVLYSFAANSTPITAYSLLAVIICIAFTGLYCLILFKTTRGYIRTRRRTQGLCPMCKYDLRGITGHAQCPECGNELKWFEDQGIVSSKSK